MSVINNMLRWSQVREVTDPTVMWLRQVVKREAHTEDAIFKDVAHIF